MVQLFRSFKAQAVFFYSLLFQFPFIRSEMDMCMCWMESIDFYIKLLFGNVDKQITTFFRSVHQKTKNKQFHIRTFWWWIFIHSANFILQLFCVCVYIVFIVLFVCFVFISLFIISFCGYSIRKYTVGQAINPYTPFFKHGWLVGWLVQYCCFFSTHPIRL